MGGLVTRAMLDKAFKASSTDSEFVANVVYNAPPFAGTTFAYLGKIFFEPPVITRAIFSDERFQKMLGTSINTAHFTLKDLLVKTIDFLATPSGHTYQEIELVINPEVRSTIDLLSLVSLNNLTPQLVASLNTGNAFYGELIALAMQAVRPFVAGILGAKGIPGDDDLTPEGGFAHLRNYVNNPDVKQFVAIGTKGASLHLFPNDLAAVANDPSLIINNSMIVAQVDDTAVPVGSAQLLTTTDNFGP